MGSKKKLVLESMCNWLVGKEKFFMNKCVIFYWEIVIYVSKFFFSC